MRVSSAGRGSPDESDTRAGRPSRWLHAVGAAVLSSMFIAGVHTFATGVMVALVLGASACALDLARRESHDPGSPVPIVCSIVALFTVAVVYPPQFSHDLWSYAIAGRMVAVHHASPYLHAAKAFPHDHFLHLVGREWRSGTTPYGPLFTLYSAGVALVGGSHPLLYRVGYQGATAVAIGFALLVVWRRKRSTSALALLGLHPVIASAVVNGGHNDAFIGLGVLVAVLCTQRERYVSAGWWITGALLVKATAGLALLPLLGWSWVRGGHRALVRIVAAPLLVAAPVMLFTPGMMHSLNSAKTNVITRTSIWNLPLRLLPNVFAPGQHVRVAHLVTLALAVVVVLVACAVWGGSRLRDPAPGVVAATAAWLVFSAYVLPWYTVWALPVAVLHPRSRLTWLVTIQGVVITAAFAIPRASLRGHNLVSDTVQLILPTLLAAMFIWAIVPVFRRATSDRTSPTSTV